MRPAAPGCCVLVLAAGIGRRFLASGADGHKLQALLGGRPLLEHTLDAVRASGLPWHIERGPHPGMGDSIAAAVRATAHADGWLVLPADLPLIQPATLLAVAQTLPLECIARPAFAGQAGHPVRFPRACLEALTRLSGDRGAAVLLATEPVITIDVPDPGCVMDIDTLADLDAARAYIRR